MFIPIGDDNSGRHRFPFLTILFVAINILVFIYYQKWGANEKFTYTFSIIPQEITSGKDLMSIVPINDPTTGQITGIFKLEETPIPIYLTLITAMFMHGSLMHLLGNMLYLWIFGDNIESKFGHFKFLIFYLGCGVIASLSHILLNIDSLIPMLGASGAIAGVLGAYLTLFPRRSIKVLVFGRVSYVPAIIVLGLWFALQVIESNTASGGGGIAYAAHIGGFIAGVVAAKIF